MVHPCHWKVNLETYSMMRAQAPAMTDCSPVTPILRDTHFKCVRAKES